MRCVTFYILANATDDDNDITVAHAVISGFPFVKIQGGPKTAHFHLLDVKLI